MYLLHLPRPRSRGMNVLTRESIKLTFLCQSRVLSEFISKPLRKVRALSLTPLKSPFSNSFFLVSRIKINTLVHLWTTFIPDIPTLVGSMLWFHPAYWVSKDSLSTHIYPLVVIMAPTVLRASAHPNVHAPLHTCHNGSSLCLVKALSVEREMHKIAIIREGATSPRNPAYRYHVNIERGIAAQAQCKDDSTQ